MAAAAAEPAALARARALYNAGSYDAAIDAASSRAGSTPRPRMPRRWCSRARTSSVFDAGGARGRPDGRTHSAWRHPHRPPCLPRDQLDLLIGLGQTLYLGEAFGAAADVFDTALGRASTLGARDRAKLLDWWATALDRQAQARTADRRVPAFSRVVERMEEELRCDPGSAIANYWLVVAARGAGDLDRAWDAAVAGWVRAALGSDTAGSARGAGSRRC